MVHRDMVNNVTHILKVFATMVTMRHQPLALKVNLIKTLPMYRAHIESYLLRRATWIWWEQCAHCGVDWCNLWWVGWWPAHMAHCTGSHCSCRWCCGTGWLTGHWEWGIVACIFRLESRVGVWNGSHFILISLKLSLSVKILAYAISIVNISCWAVRCL